MYGLSDGTIQWHNGGPWYETIKSWLIFYSILQLTGTFHFERHDILLQANGSRIIYLPTRFPHVRKDADYFLHRNSEMWLRISEEKKKVRAFVPRNINIGRMLGKPGLYLFTEVANEMSIC